MPIFFIISGIFFSTNMGIKSWINKKTNRLIIPYITFYTITYLLNLILHLLKIKTKNPFSYIDFFQIFWKDVFSNNVIWFLLALFWSSLLLYIIIKYSNNTITEILCISLSYLLGYSCYLFNINIPLYIDSAFSSVIFIYFGYLLKKHRVIETINSKRSVKMITLIFSISLICSLLNIYAIQGISLITNSIRNPFLFLLGGLSGSLFILGISYIIKKIPIISFIGKESIIVLCTHMYIINLLVKIFNKVEDQELIPILIFFTTIISYYFISPIFHKYLPFLIGERKNAE